MSKKIFLRWVVRFLIFGLFFIPIIKKSSSFVIYYMPFVLGVVSCGWLCPVGLLEDIVFIKKFSVEVNEKLHKCLRFLRYIFMILFFAGLFYYPVKIRSNINNLALLKIEDVNSLPFLLAILTLIISIFINRFFCRYICPFGAIGGVKSLLRFVTINRNLKTCVGCGNCNKVCPMKIKMSLSDSSFSPNCINCLKCVENCPKKSLRLGLRNYKNTFRQIKGYFSKAK